MTADPTCGACGLTADVAGFYCTRCLAPTGSTTATIPPTGSAQRCLCGREEYPGSFCSFCKSASYDLIDHTHRVGPACPLGPFLDPLDQQPSSRARFARDVARWEAAGRPPDGGVVLGTRHHPATPLPTARRPRLAAASPKAPTDTRTARGDQQAAIAVA